MADEETKLEAEETDPDADLVAPSSFRAYVEFVKHEVEVIRWLFNEFTTPESRQWSAWLIVWLTLVYLIGMGLPVVVGMAVNRMNVLDTDGATTYSLAYLGICCVQQLCWYRTDIAREWALGLSFCKLDERVSELVHEKTLGQHERYASRLNHATIDKGRWKALELLAMLAFQGTPTFLMVAISLVFLAYMAPMGGLVGCVIAVCYCAWSLYLNFNASSAMNPVEREFRRNNRKRVEAWEKIQRVHTNGTGRRDIEELSVHMNKIMRDDRLFWTWFSGHAAWRMLLLQRCFQTFMMIWSAHMIQAKTLDIGALFPLLYWTEQFAANLWMLSQIERHTARNIVPVQLMREALSIPPAFDMYAGAEIADEEPLGLELKNVSYSYEDKQGKTHQVLHDVSFRVLPGEKLAVFGTSGAGKSTLMKLMLRFDDPSAGTILVNGTPLTELQYVSLMRKYGYIPQNAEILSTTLGENLLYGVSPAERDEFLRDGKKKLWELARVLKIDFGEKRLTKGLDTRVGHHGVELSGGQKQRVMIGAAVAKKPKLYLVDEATSNLDSSTEKEVQEGFAPAFAGDTTGIVIAHRLSTVRALCTKFLVLRPIEEVAETGENQVEAIAHSFEELHAISPTFRKLAKDQGLAL